MKKNLLSIAMLFLATVTVGQNRPSTVSLIKERLYQTGRLTPERVQVMDATGNELPVNRINQSVTRQPNNSNKSSLVQTLIGSTTYDLQSNGSIQNRIYKKNGNVHAVWTGSTDQAGTYPDRGTWYNSNTGSWGANPTSRIETDRRGWPSLVQLANGNEVVVSHGSVSNPTAINRRTTAGGTGGWTQTPIPGFATGQNTLWARTAAGGPDGNTVHMIDISYPTGNGGTAVNGLNGCLSYSRSLDGGQNWDVLRVIPPGIDSTLYNGFRADAYAIDSKDNTVAFVSGNLTDDWALWKSTDNGSTWTRTVIWDFPFTKYDDVTQTTDVDGDGVADTVLTTDGAYAILIDNNGMVHAFAGAMLVLDDDPAANIGLFLSTDGLLYWNESFGSNDPVVIATAPDIDGDGVASSFATNLGGRYGNDGICSMPSAAIDAAGNIYLSYCPLIELTDNGEPDPTNFSFRNVYLMASTDNGATWGVPINVSNSNFDEAVFCALAKNVDNCVSMIWQQDGAPGYSVPPNGQHPVGSNDIIYDCIDPTLVLGISNPTANNQNAIQIFPNPASDWMTISIDASDLNKGNIQIRNLMGQVVAEMPVSNQSSGVLKMDLNVKSLADGVYTLSITDENNINTVKFVKN
ncbi:MAG: T9SS type A sorting domain-containing protein [Bacteroidota bacterium]|jgi:hypothetical protein